MKGGFTFDILNHNSVQENNNNNGSATGPATPLLHEKSNFTRYPLNNCEIIDLADDDVAEIPPPFSAPAQQTRPDLGSFNLMPHQQSNYSYQNGMGLSNYQNAPHNQNGMGLSNYQNTPHNQNGMGLSNYQNTPHNQNGMGLSNYQSAPHNGPLGELLEMNNYKIAPHSDGFETHYVNYANPPITGQMERNLGFQNLNSDYLMPAQQGYSSSSSRPIRSDMSYSNSANNGIINANNGIINGSSMNFQNMINNINNNNPHGIISSQPNGLNLNFSNPRTETQPQTGTNSITQTEPGLFPLGAPAQQNGTALFPLAAPAQQTGTDQEVVPVPTEEVGTNQISLENQGIDLNKTPQPKQRRRKYVPKVMREGKKPRAPKSGTPKSGIPKSGNPKSGNLKSGNPEPGNEVQTKPGNEVRVKRKYVRKKGIAASETPDKTLEVPGSCTPNGGEKSIVVPNSCTPNGVDKSIEVPGFCTPNGGEKPVQVPNSCTPNGVGESIQVPNSCTQNGVNKSIEVPNLCTPNGTSGISTSGARKPVRRSLNFDQEELNPNAYMNNANINNPNNVSQPHLTTVPVPPPSTGTTVPVSNSTVRPKQFSLDLNRSTNQVQEEFERTFPVTSSAQKTGTNQNSTNRVQNGSGINFSGYPYPPTPPNVRTNDHAINNNIIVGYERNLTPDGLLSLAMKNEQLIRASLGNNNSHMNNLISMGGIKRDHNILLQQGNNSSRVIETQKKMRITDRNNNNNINTSHQNGIVRPNSSNPNSSSISLHNAGPPSGIFSLADAQRIMEMRRKQNAQAQLMLNGPQNVITSTAATTTCQVATPDRPEFWFSRSETGQVNQVPVMNNNNTNNSRPMSQVNQIAENSIQTYSEKTTAVNQLSNNSVLTTEKPEPKKRGRQKKDKETLTDPNSTTPPAKEKQPKPRGRRPKSLIAASALSFEATVESIILKMRVLDINRLNATVPVQPYQSFAMVPYNNGMTGTMVPYENGEKKKRKSRARVNLDPVTNHVWNLLMGKEMSEGLEPLDEKKEKELENERVIFKGRIDSFIARMHLVQGDRRFSPWKGSVVDSVVGVFLTQNVSDHLSSSAFMGLVSKYPPQTRPVNPDLEPASVSIRSIISLRNFHGKEITIEDFSSEEKDENNSSSQGSSSKCPQPHLQEEKNVNKSAAESSPDSGPGLVIDSVEEQNGPDLVGVMSLRSPIEEQTGPDLGIMNSIGDQNGPDLGMRNSIGLDLAITTNSTEDQNSVVSSQNSVVSSQNSTEDLSGSNGSGWLFDLDLFGNPHTSYTQLLHFAESNRSDLFPDLNKVSNATCSYSDNSRGYSPNGNNGYSACPSPSGIMNNNTQNGNNGYSACPSGIMNNSHNGNNGYSACPSGIMNSPQNGNSNYSHSVMHGMFNGNNTGLSGLASHNLNLEMGISGKTGISIPHSPISNQASPQPITPMVKITQSTPNYQNTPIMNPLSRNAYTNSASPKTASETAHTALNNSPNTTASVTVHNALNNSPKTASETAHNSKPAFNTAASESVQNTPNINNNSASETVQTTTNNNQNKLSASESVHTTHHTTTTTTTTTTNKVSAASETVQKTTDGVGTAISEAISSSTTTASATASAKPPRRGSAGGKAGKKPAKPAVDWDSLRRGVRPAGGGETRERSHKAADSLDYEALRRASVRELSDAIRERGMNNMLAERIKDFLERLVRDHGSTDLEWLRDVDPDKAKDYLLSVRGLGLKSVECVRLLTLHHLAFPVDTNVGRICVRLGWVPLQPLPESLQLHLLEMYPILENIQKYLWPRLCKLDQRTLYELHYQMITFGKVFCTKSKPNCNACPMRAECKHFASAFASARLALPGPEEKGIIPSSSSPTNPSSSSSNWRPPVHPPTQFSLLSSSTPPFHPSSSTPPPFSLPSSSSPNWRPPVHPTLTNTPPPFSLPSSSSSNWMPPVQSSQPIIEEPASPEPEPDKEQAIEDAFLEEDPDEIPTIKLNVEEFQKNLREYFKRNNLDIEEADMSKALVAISPEKASLPTPKLKNISRLRTEHLVYELPDNHKLLAGYERREPDDPCPYLLSIWTPGETAVSTDPPKSLCISQDVNELCDKEACLRCVGIKEARRQVVRGTVLIPCRTAMRGSFPLNGTYFQVNELFADHESSRQPVEIPRGWIWNLPRRTVYFGTSIPTIFKGLSTEEIQHCFWRGFVCVRGFDRVTRAPRPLYARLHFPASKLNKNGRKGTKDEE